MTKNTQENPIKPLLPLFYKAPFSFVSRTIAAAPFFISLQGFGAALDRVATLAR